MTKEDERNCRGIVAAIASGIAGVRDSFNTYSIRRRSQWRT